MSINNLKKIEKFDVFISHNKLDASIFARYIKLTMELFLNNNSKYDPTYNSEECEPPLCYKIFYDSDHLYNLKLLFEIIQNNNDMFCFILLTPSYFKSFWCMIELYLMMKYCKNIIILLPFTNLNSSDITHNEINTQTIYLKKNNFNINETTLPENYFTNLVTTINSYYVNDINIQDLNSVVEEIKNIIYDKNNKKILLEFSNYSKKILLLLKSSYKNKNIIVGFYGLNPINKTVINILMLLSNMFIKKSNNFLNFDNYNKMNIKDPVDPKNKLGNITLFKKFKKIKYVIIITDSNSNESFFAGEVFKLISKYSNWKKKYKIIIKTFNKPPNKDEINEDYLPIIFLLLSENIINNQKLIDTILIINSFLQLYNKEILYQGIDIKKNYNYLNINEYREKFKMNDDEKDVLLNLLSNVISFEFNVNTHIWLLKYQVLTILFKLFQLKLL